MFTLAVTGFVFACIGLCGLFALKYIEERSGIIYLRELRADADRHAHIVKATMRYLAMRTEQLPQDLIVFLRMTIHFCAMLFAQGARAAEKTAHQVADRVSHKHHFVRGETHSEFLKTVSAHKNGLETRH